MSNKKEKKTEILSVKTKQNKKKQFHIYTTVIFKANKKEGGASGANIETFLKGQKTERKKLVQL